MCLYISLGFAEMMTMARKERLNFITEIQKKTASHVICYVTSTRNNLEVQMAMDSIRKIYDHLQEIKKPKSKTKISLFLHSNGGDGTVPWRLVTLIREYAERFTVLVPHKAFSAATLTALGADEIIMHPMGMLGPTDPTVMNPFNPANAIGQPIGISVEDVSAYIALIKEDAGIQHEDELVQAFNKLAEKVHPLALGNVKRSISQSRMMAKKLLSLHMDAKKAGHQIDEIVDNLTSKLFYHGHPINRKEAKSHLGLNAVVSPNKHLETLMWKLYLDYENEMLIDEPFQPAMEFSAQFPNLAAGATEITPAVTAKLCFVESVLRADVSIWQYVISGTKLPNGSIQVTPITNRQGWIREP
jgi:hypothetical protein